MNYTITNLNTGYLYAEQQLDQLERQLVTMTHPTREEWWQILNWVNALQYYPEHKQHPLRARILESLKHQHRISDLLISAIERDHDRIRALLDLSRENIRGALKSPLTIVPNQIFSSIHNLIDGFRIHLRLEEEIMIPMIRTLTTAETNNEGSADCADELISVVVMQPGTRYLN